MARAASEDPDQSGQSPSLIRVFAVRMKKSWVLRYLLSAQRILGCPGWSKSLLGAHAFFYWFCHALAQLFHPLRFSGCWTSYRKLTEFNLDRKCPNLVSSISLSSMANLIVQRSICPLLCQTYISDSKDVDSKLSVLRHRDTKNYLLQRRERTRVYCCSEAAKKTSSNVICEHGRHTVRQDKDIAVIYLNEVNKSSPDKRHCLANTDNECHSESILCFSFLFKVSGYTRHIFHYFYKGSTFYDFLFAFLHTNPFLKTGLL